MIFGATEIFLCLASTMAVILAIGLSLLAKNISIDHKERWKGQIPCPHCGERLNAESYICKSCLIEVKEPIGLR